METKMHRYMQRIEKIISTPTKSPIRPTKSPLKCRTNQLDQYLRYELSGKIINSVIKRHHDQLVILFFNLIQRSQCRQKERIFKFVAIQKKDIKVDLGISAKIMVTVLKQIFRNRFTTFAHNMQLLGTKDQQSTFKKGEDAMKSAVLLRTSSRPDKQNYKEISQFNYDGSSSVGKEPNFKKYQQLKAYTAKTIIKLIHGKVKRLKVQALSKIQHHAIAIRERAIFQSKNLPKQNKQKQSDSWSDKELLYIQQIDNLKQALNKEKELSIQPQLPQPNIKMDKRIQSIQTIKQFFTHWLQINKQKILNGIRILVPHRRINSKISDIRVKSMQQGKAIREISFIGFSNLRRAFSCLKDSYFSAREKATKRQDSILYFCLVLGKKIASIYHMGIRQLLVQAKRSIQRSKNFGQDYIKQLRTSPVPDLYDIHSSKKQFFETEETHNPIIKHNFYSFMDKIFKLILIISKMLIPLKEAFVKIDLYASYSYRVEECFKPLYQNRLRFALEAIKARKPLRVIHSGAELKIAAVLERVTRQKFIEVFSYLKILWKQKDLKIKIFPVRQSIIESTRYFLEERNIYTLYSMDYWEKIKQNQFNQPGNPEKEDFPKRRSNTTF